MRRTRIALASATFAVLALCLTPGGVAQDDGVLDSAELGALLTGLGHEHKDIGTEGGGDL